jgi:glycosyltransferase involved in cell wall biosynthesis
MSAAPEILFVLPVLEPAGTERVVAELARRLPTRGFSTAVICLEDERAAVGKELVASNVTVEGLRLWRRRTLACAKALARRIAERRPSVINAHLFHANIATRLALKRLAPAQRERTPLISTIHVAERRFRPWQFLFDRITASHSHCEVCVSRAVARFQRERTGLPESFFRVIENGIDVTRFAGPDRPLRKAGEGHVVSVGRLDPQKDFPTLLRAWKMVEEQCPHAHLTIAGSGSEEDRLRALGGALKLERAQFIGFINDIPKLLREADIYAQPSAWEGFGLAVAEAMAAGLPAIVSDADSLPELVTHEKTGWVVPKGNAAALASALTTLLNDPAQAARLGLAARADAATRFSVERMVDDYAALFQEVMS